MRANNDERERQVRSYRIIGANALLDVLTGELVAEIASYDRILIEEATGARIDAVEEEVSASAALIDAVVVLITLLVQDNAADAEIDDADAQLAACLDVFNVSCQNTDAVDTELLEDLPNARDRRRRFYRYRVAELLPGVHFPGRAVAPVVDERTLMLNVDACMRENLDFTRDEAADFLREEAVVQEITASIAVMHAAVSMVWSRENYGASSVEVDNAVTALADRREDYHAASDASDRSDMSLMAEIRDDHGLRRNAVTQRFTQVVSQLQP